MSLPYSAVLPTATSRTRRAAPPPTPEKAAKVAAAKAEAEHDATLVRRFIGGDEPAFVEIMERYRDKLFAISLSLLRNHADAEEIVQDTFIRAHRGLVRFRGDSSLATWLHRIAVNLARNRYWYFHRRRRHATLSMDCAIGDDGTATFSDLLASDAATPSAEVATNEFSVLVTRCMDLLDAKQREILTMRTLLNQSYADIAQSLGINEGTVKSRIARARGHLLSLMTHECPDFGENASAGDWFERAVATSALRAAP